VDVQPRQGGAGPAFKVTVTAGAAKHNFIAGWAGEGWPSDVERLAHLVPDVEVVAAVNLSDGARKWLSHEGLDWVDEVGHAEVSRKSGLVISREPTHIREGPEPSVRWSRSIMTVAEATLSGVVPTVDSVERATGLSRHAVANALARLERLGFLERPNALRGPRSARRIVDTGNFLDAYAKAAADQDKKQSHVLVHRLWRGDPLDTLASEIGPALNRTGINWALTGTGASVLLAPYLSDVTTLELYIDAEAMADRTGLASLLGGRIIDKGQRIEIREIPTAMTIKGPQIMGIQVAIPVRVYADLIAAGGRWAEAGQHLRETLNVGTAA